MSPSLLRRVVVLASWALALLSAAPANAQPLPPEKAPADDPRKGPRLEYKRGPDQCPDEQTFRQRVTYWLDGVDHLAADSADVVRVAFERAPWGGYRATVAYTDAAGQSAPVETIVQDGDHCVALAWWVALVVSDRVPPKPPRPPCPDPPPCPGPPPCPACPAPRCPPRAHACPAQAVLKPQPPLWYEGSMIGFYGFVLLTGGLVADPGVAFSLGVDLRGKAPEDPWAPTWSFGVEARVAPPGKVYAREVIDPNKASYPTSFEISQFTGLFVPCARWKYFFGCGVLQGGVYFVPNGAVYQTSAALTVGPRLGLRFPIGERFALFGLGEALFVPMRTGFTAAGLPGEPDPNVLWGVSEAQGYAAAGLEFTFE